LMMEAAAADVLGVISDGTEVSICWDGIWRCVSEGGDSLVGGVCGLGGSKKSASEWILGSVDRDGGEGSSSGGVTETERRD
jgi:hypothetical protein